MPNKRYLLCPQCGAHRYFVEDGGGGRAFFHVDWERRPFPTEESGADLRGVDVSTIRCCGCSWSGGIGKLVKYV